MLALQFIGAFGDNFESHLNCDPTSPEYTFTSVQCLYKFH